MDRTNVIWLQCARDQRGVAEPNSQMDQQGDPKVIALRLCKDVAAAGRAYRSMTLGDVAKLSLLSKEDIIVGAAYGHACGWLIFSFGRITLTRGGELEATISYQRSINSWRVAAH